MLGFSKVRRKIADKLKSGEGGLYIYFAFPVLFAFFLTFSVARLFSHFFPKLFFIVNGVHLHHFAYGIFVLAIAGYIALFVRGPRGKFWVSLLYGFGLGLAFDEFGMWLNLESADFIRWEYDGVILVVVSFLTLLLLRPGIKTIKTIFGFGVRELESFFEKNHRQLNHD